MVGKYKVITICGSTRFKDAFLEAQKRLTLEGNIVISVGLFGHSGDEEVWAPGTKEMYPWAFRCISSLPPPQKSQTISSWSGKARSIDRR